MSRVCLLSVVVLLACARSYEALPQKEVATSVPPSNSRGLVWVEGPWGQCSKRSGSGGVKSRVVTCQKINGNGINSKVPHKECFDLLGPNPELFQPCNEDAPPTWYVGDWSPCDNFCDEGKQTRVVVCQKNINGAIELLHDENCTEEKPKEEQPCIMELCTDVEWVTSEWFGCDSCTSKFRTRMVMCASYRQVLNERSCSHIHRPENREACPKAELPACEVQWYPTQWSNCSVNCGDGEQTRTVFCGMYYNDESGAGVKVVDDAKCANLTKNYKDTKPCTVPKEECPSVWFAGAWSDCTETCGEGEQYRRVMCFRGDQSTSDCDGATVFDSTQLCNIGPCDLAVTFTEEAQA